MTQLLSKCMSIVILLSTLITPTAVFGQSASNEELLAIIKKLEARIVELETKAGKSAEPATAAKPSTEPAAEPSVAELKKEVEELKKRRQRVRPSSISSRRLRSRATSMDTMDMTSMNRRIKA
jgi:hypothetical protein